jgi:hypothetical protein
MVYDVGRCCAVLQGKVGRLPPNKRRAKELSLSEDILSSSDGSDDLLELFDSSSSDADETFARIFGADWVSPPCVPPSINN